MAGLNFSNRELRDAMREMSLTDSRVTLKEQMNDTYEDMKDLSEKGKVKMGEYTAELKKKMEEAKLGEKSSAALASIKASSAQYTESFSAKMKEAKVSEKLAGAWSATAGVTAGLSAGLFARTASTKSAPPAHQEPSEVKPGEDAKAKTTVVSGEDDEDDDAAAPGGEDGAAADSAAGAAPAAGYTAGIGKTLSGLGTYMPDTTKVKESVSGYTKVASEYTAKAATYSKEKLGPAWEATAKITAKASESVIETTAKSSKSTWAELQDFSTFIAKDFRDFTVDVEESVSYLTSASAQLYAGNKKIPATGAAVFLGTIEGQWAVLDKGMAENDAKLQTSGEELRRLVVKWMRNREQFDAYEAELKNLPMVAQDIKGIVAKIEGITESIGELEAALAEAEKVTHENALAAKRAKFEEEFQAREMKHRARLEEWESQQASWAHDAEENRKNWSQEQEAAVASLQEQLQKEAEALAAKASQGTKTKAASTPYGTAAITEVAMTLNPSENTLMSRKELDAFYQDDEEDEDIDRQRRMRRNKKREESEPILGTK